MDEGAAGRTFVIGLFLASALALGSGRALSAGRAKPAAGAPRSFLFVARVGPLVGGSTARSCTIYLNEAGLIQKADEETGGILHGLSEGQGDMSSFLREANEETSPPPAAPPANPPSVEFYAARIAITSLSPDGKYRADSYEAPATPPKVAELARRVETDVRARPLRPAPAGLYGRARRQLNFDPEIEKLHAMVPAGQLGSLPLLSSLVTQEMSLVRLGPPGEPGRLTKDLQIVPGRVVRVKVGDLVYVIQAYDFRSPEGQGGNLKRKDCE